MLIGFEKQKSYFKKVILGGTVSHAYLFSGPESIGKLGFAKEIYNQLNNKKNGDIDGDIIIVTPRISEEGEIKNIPIEDIRNLPAFLSRSSTSNKYKAVIIDDADRLTIEAANALLKNLEEPLPKRIFFLITSRSEMLPPTIRSRCQEIRFNPHDDGVILKESKKLGLTAEDAEFVTMISRGRLGVAINMIREKSIPAIKKDLKDFQQVAKQGIFQQFIFTKNIVEQGRARELSDLWLSWARTRLTATEKAPIVLHALIKLNYELSQYQYNQRLALERFFMAI